MFVSTSINSSYIKVIVIIFNMSTKKLFEERKVILTWKFWTIFAIFSPSSDLGFCYLCKILPMLIKGNWCTGYEIRNILWTVLLINIFIYTSYILNYNLQQHRYLKFWGKYIPWSFVQFYKLIAWRQQKQASIGSVPTLARYSLNIYL